MKKQCLQRLIPIFTGSVCNLPVVNKIKPARKSGFMVKYRVFLLLSANYKIPRHLALQNLNRIKL
jgi:hypothetical protein